MTFCSGAVSVICSNRASISPMGCAQTSRRVFVLVPSRRGITAQSPALAGGTGDFIDDMIQPRAVLEADTRGFINGGEEALIGEFRIWDLGFRICRIGLRSRLAFLCFQIRNPQSQMPEIVDNQASPVPCKITRWWIGSRSP